MLYSIEYQLYTSSNLQTVSAFGVSIDIDMNIIELRNNIFLENFAGGTKGMINLIGFQRIYLNNETYASNGENTIEVVEEYGNLGIDQLMYNNLSLAYSDLSDTSKDLYMPYSLISLTRQTSSPTSLQS